MTFSVDVDFSPFRAGPLQDATTRERAGEGRGKDFASSLFGVAPGSLPSADFTSEDSEGLSLASLSLAQVAPSPAEAPLMVDASVQSPPAEILSAEALSVIPTVAPAEPQPDIKPGLVHEVSAPRPDAALPPGPDAEILPAEQTELLSADTDLSDTAVAQTEKQAIEETAPVEGSSQKASPSEVMLSIPAQATPVHAAVPAVGKMLAETGISVASTLPAAKATPTSSPEPALPRGSSALAEAEHATHADLAADLVTAQTDTPEAEISAVRLEAAGNGDAGAGTPTASSSSLTPAIGSALSQATTTSAQPANLTAAQLAPTHAVLVATATQLPDIVARATSEGQDDRVVVQLDPPELGRVSIDFKFDAQGLQHVTITAESPEAMRQLRQMHFELVQALERNGLSGQNMSFQHQNPQQNEGWGQQAKPGNARFDSPALSSNGLILAADSNPHRQIASSGRLDIRL